MSKFNQLGTTGLNRAGNIIDEEFLPQLRYPRAACIYKEMSANDPVIGAILYMSDQLARKTTWRVEAGGSKAIDLKAAKFLEECMDDMDTTWADFISEALTAFVYGFSFNEIIYKYRREATSKYPDGRIGWRDFAPRAQSSLYGWEFDSAENVTAFIQQAPPLYNIVKIPLKKGILFRTQATKRNPEGKSLLRNAYRPWYFKKKIEEIEGIGIERDLAGLPVLQAPEGLDIYDMANEESVRMLQVAQGLVTGVRRDQNEGVVIPAGWEFKLLSTGGSRQFDTSEIITRYDQRIATVMLSDLIMLGSNSVGSFALAKVKQSLLAGALEAQLINLAEEINRSAVTPLFKYNAFPGLKQLPKLVPGEVETPDLAELGSYFRDIGLRMDDDYQLNCFMRQVASMPILSEEEFNKFKEDRNVAREQTTSATASHTNEMDATKKVDEHGEYKITREGGQPNG